MTADEELREQHNQTRKTKEERRIYHKILRLACAVAAWHAGIWPHVLHARRLLSKMNRHTSQVPTCPHGTHLYVATSSPHTEQRPMPGSAPACAASSCCRTSLSTPTTTCRWIFDATKQEKGSAKARGGSRGGAGTTGSRGDGTQQLDIGIGIDIDDGNGIGIGTGIAAASGRDAGNICCQSRRME